MKGILMNRTAHRASRWLLVSLLVPLALLASACLPEGVRVPQNQIAAALERKAGLIAYLSTDGNIYTIDQAGGRKTQITHDAYISDTTFLFYGLPTWSHDSQSLAFVSYAGNRGQNPSSMGLYTAGKDGKALTQALTSTQPLVYFSWSPDNRRVSFISSTGGNNLAFQVIGADGRQQQLVDAGTPYYWAWAPDGHTVLAHNGSHLSLLQVGDNVTEQALNFDAQAFRAPAFSPNGQQMLVAAVSADGHSALLLADAQGQNAKPLAQDFGNVAFVWSPDGQRVAYLTSADGAAGTTGHLVVVDPSGKSKPVELPGSDVYAFFWSPDSKSLAYFTAAPSASGAPTPTPDPSGSSSSADFHLKLSVLDAHSGASHTVAPAFSPSERFLDVIPYFDQYGQSLTIWSPDSTNLVVSAYRGDGVPAVWVVNASGRLDPRFIDTGWMGFWSWK
jgi:Tol biopolymer transport system component